MVSRFSHIISAFFTVAILLSACGNPQAQTISMQNVSTAPNGVVPDTLATIEAQAEDIIDFVPGGEWSRVNSDILAIEKAWEIYTPQATNDGASQALKDGFAEALSKLKSTAASQDKIGTLQASNDLSAVVVELFDLYHPVIPADIGRLDVLERQIILDVENQNFTAGTKTFAKTITVWEQVKPSILAHSGQSVVEQFDNSLAVQSTALKAQDGSTLIDEARNGLEIVDAMESLY
jgi:hypothetical protein